MLGPDYCAEADQLVTLTFPMAAPELEEAIAGVNYTLLIKGKDVFFIDPTGKHYPIYRGFAIVTITCAGSNESASFQRIRYSVASLVELWNIA